MTSFWGPHAPYLPATDFADMYNPKDIAQWDSFTDDLLNKPYIHSIYRKYIFPGGDIPTLFEIMPAIEKSGLIISDIEVLRLHYAKTLSHWYKNFKKAHKMITW